MRVVICTDLEGIAGVDHYADCFPAWPRRYARAQALMEAEVNAVIDGLRDAGVDDIVVTDWHFVGNNLRRDRIDEPVLGLWRAGEPRMDRSVYGDADLALFVGMHAAAGDTDAFTSHTFWQGLAVEVDGVAVNEAYLWATMVAAAGAPIGFVAGESRVIDECAALLPDVPVLGVKSSRSRTRARTDRPVEDVRAELRDAAAAAVGDIDCRSRFDGRVGAPVHVTFYEQAAADRAARRGIGEPDGERRIATTLREPDGLIPLAADCLLTTFLGREAQVLARIAPPPERTSLPDPVRRAVVGCVHGATMPLVRRGVHTWMAEDVDRYPPAPRSRDDRVG